MFCIFPFFQEGSILINVRLSGLVSFGFIAHALIELDGVYDPSQTLIYLCTIHVCTIAKFKTGSNDFHLDDLFFQGL